MTRKFTSPSRKILLIVTILLIAIVGSSLYRNHSNNSVVKAEHPEYLSFAGNYVYSIPKNYTVDEQSLAGVQFVYSGKLAVKTVEDVYSQNGIAVQSTNDQKDHSAKGFKDYVNKTFVPDVKKSLSVNDVKVKFGKANGADNARVTVKKDGKQIRFIFLKNGQHPVSVISKDETAAFKKIEQTMVDIEKSDLKDATASIKQVLQTNIQLAKEQKAADLYNSAAPELKSKNTQAELSSALQASSDNLKQNVTISGISYSASEFTAALRFDPVTKDAQSTFGAMAFKKTDGQWKLELLTLPKAK